MSHFGKRSRIGFFGALFALGAAMLGVAALAQDEVAEPAPKAPGKGVILSLKGAVTPANAGYLAREIEAASAAEKDLILIEVDTPGGLMDSMKTIIKAILASDTPVATYVSPQGARSASAGLYIMYAAHISAMAPSTNTGAATPVEVGGAPSEDRPFRDDAAEDAEKVTNPDAREGGDEAEETRNDSPAEVRDEGRKIAPLSSDNAMRAKVINDAVAYIRALAEERGRNADWAESAVREAVSVTSREALELGVIDYVADDIDDLMAQLDGKTVVTASGEKILATADIALERIEPSMLEKILGFIADPNVAVILMSLATTGIIIEMWNPGSIFPGVFGLVCLILGLYAFQVLPFNWLGVVLLGVGVICITLEAYTPTFGLVGIAGLALFAFGLFIIFPEGFRVSSTVIGSAVVTIGATLAWVRRGWRCIVA